VAVKIFFVFREKAWGQRETFVKYGRSHESGFDPILLE
jgi:hypothetical protein